MPELTRRERMAIPRQDMPEREAEERARDFDEVNLGFTSDLAILEATRCIECRRPTCVEGCPVGIRIDEFVTAVAAGEFETAAEVIHRDSSLPAICGRVCPQESQCEGTCVLGRKHRPVAIGHLERFVADWEREHAPRVVAVPAATSGRRVAVVGSGPAGLACATDLVRAGHDVTVFEALHEPGGVLVYGIPEFRLPKAIVRAEVEGLERLGVEFVTNAVIGMTITLDQLLDDEGFDAVFIGVGAGLPRFMGIPGENLVGVYSANEFLTRVNLMRAYDPHSETPVYDLVGRTVMVFGGGNTAMDAVRTALRLGARRAAIVYRRTEAEMPARDEEIAHAKAEGVDFVELTAPTEFIGSDEGWLTEVRLQEMQLGEPDDSGRRRPQPVDGAVRTEPCDVAIVAIGNRPNPLLTKTTSGLETTRWGTLVVDEATGQTSRPGVFAAGDIVTGGATVILAMGGGRRAAAAINEYLAR
jgi:glutamate synthase (NADPH/NADH) small chain